MMYVVVNVAVLFLVVVFQVITLDAYIKKLVDRAISEQCSECKHRVASAIEESEHAV